MREVIWGEEEVETTVANGLASLHRNGGLTIGAKYFAPGESIDLNLPGVTVRRGSDGWVTITDDSGSAHAAWFSDSRWFWGSEARGTQGNLLSLRDHTLLHGPVSGVIAWVFSLASLPLSLYGHVVSRCSRIDPLLGLLGGYGVIVVTFLIAFCFAQICELIIPR